MNTLFVCLGNICRSPMAAGLLRHHFDRHGINSIVDSAGLMDWNVGRPADHRSVYVARLHSIDISQHVARQICDADFEKFEQIFVMDRANLRAIKQIAPPHLASSIQLLAGSTEIPDPYHGAASDFQRVFSVIESAVANIVERELESG